MSEIKAFLSPSAKPEAFGFTLETADIAVAQVKLMVTPSNGIAISMTRPDADDPESRVAIIRTLSGSEVLDMFWLMAARGTIRQYVHHGNQVYVDRGQQGLHRHFCLCHTCKAFKPNTSGNCMIAETLYKVCKDHGLVTPVWECPKYQRDVV